MERTPSVHFVNTTSSECIKLFCIVLHYITVLYIVLCHVMSYHISHYIILYYIILYYIILYYIILYYIILYYIIYPFPWHHFQINIQHNGGQTQDSPASTVTRSCAGQPKVQSLAVTRYSLFSKMCRPAPATTHPPTQGLPSIIPCTLSNDNSSIILFADLQVQLSVTYVSRILKEI